MISAGAKVLGSFTIGENSKIGAGSVVLSGFLQIQLLLECQEELLREK